MIQQQASVPMVQPPDTRSPEEKKKAEEDKWDTSMLNHDYRTMTLIFQSLHDDSRRWQHVHTFHYHGMFHHLLSSICWLKLVDRSA